MLPTSQYKPGAPPPAHMSPFVDNETEGYVPMRQKEIQHLKGEEVVESENEDEEMVAEEPVKKPAAKKARGKVKQISQTQPPLWEQQKQKGKPAGNHLTQGHLNSHACLCSCASLYISTEGTRQRQG